MLFRDVIELITTTTTQNDYGDEIETPTYTQVFANKTFVRRVEHYEAMANGLRPSLVLEIKEIDYNGEKQLRFNGVTYDIIRTDPTKREMLEIVCQGANT